MKKIVMILVAVIGFGLSANAQNDVSFRGLPTGLCWKNERIILFPKGYNDENKYKYSKVFEIWTGGTLFQSGTWEYKIYDKSIELTIKNGLLQGQAAKFKLTSVKTNKYGFLVSMKFTIDEDNIAEYINCDNKKD
jgi:hypothetical protein